MHDVVIAIVSWKQDFIRASERAVSEAQMARLRGRAAAVNP